MPCGVIAGGVAYWLAGVAAVKAPKLAELIFNIGLGAAVSVPFVMAAEAIAEEWKRPEQGSPVNVADIPY